MKPGRNSQRHQRHVEVACPKGQQHLQCKGNGWAEKLTSTCRGHGNVATAKHAHSPGREKMNGDVLCVIFIISLFTVTRRICSTNRILSCPLLQSFKKCGYFGSTSNRCSCTCSMCCLCTTFSVMIEALEHNNEKFDHGTVDTAHCCCRPLCNPHPATKNR